jgi:flagellar biosynthetic protein FliR
LFGFSAGFIVFARLLGFIRFAPILNRKEIAVTVKISLALLLTMMITPLVNPGEPPSTISPMLLLLLNFAVGAIIGYIAQLIILAIEAGGDMINTQMGLSSAMVMDPSTNSQTSILSRMITILALCIFIQIGGLYWLFNALLRSFEIFPVYAVHIPLDKIILETDDPYLPPVPYRGKRNEPSYMVEVAKKIAEVKVIDIKEVAEATTNNARKLFNL